MQGNTDEGMVVLLKIVGWIGLVIVIVLALLCVVGGVLIGLSR